MIPLLFPIAGALGVGYAVNDAAGAVGQATGTSEQAPSGLTPLQIALVGAGLVASYVVVKKVMK